MAPGAVGYSHDGLLTVLEALAARQQSHALDEVPIRVVIHRRGVSVKNGKLSITSM